MTARIRGDEQSVEVVVRAPVGASVFLAGLLLVMAVLPLTGAAVTLARGLTALVIGAIALAVGAVGWPRARSVVVVELPSRRFRSGAHSGTLGDRAALVLGSALAVGDGRPRFDLTLVAGRTAMPLFETDDPGAVVDVVHELRQRLDLPVRCNWKLPADATPWCPADGASRMPELELRVDGADRARTSGFTVLAFGLVVTFAMAFMLSDRMREGYAISALSYVLAGATCATMTSIGIALLFRQIWIRTGESLTVETRIFGVLVRRRRRARPRRAYLVGSSADGPVHVLFEVDAGAVAVPIGPGEQRVVTDALELSG